MCSAVKYPLRDRVVLVANSLMAESYQRGKSRRRDIEREGEIIERERGDRDREVKGIERVKGAQSKPNPSPNAFPKFCKWFSGLPTKREGDAHGSLFERKILVKSPEPGNRAQRKVEYKNYHAQL